MNPIKKNALGGSSIKLFGLYQPPLRSRRQDLDAEQRSAAEQFSKEGDEHQHQAVTETIADPVEEADPGAVLHRKSFGASHHDAVGDDQADEHRQLLADVVHVGLQDLVDHDHQRRDHRHLHDDADAAGNEVANRTDRQIAERGHRDHGDTHHQRRFHLGCHRQGTSRFPESARRSGCCRSADQQGPRYSCLSAIYLLLPLRLVGESHIRVRLSSLLKKRAVAIIAGPIANQIRHTAAGDRRTG